jgi:hypothetical protein
MPVKTVPLSEARGYLVPDQVPSSDESKLYAEIAERMLEVIGLTSISRFNRWLGVLVSLAQRDHEAEVWLLRFQTGDIAWLTKPYSAIGSDSARSKQAVEQSFERALVQLCEVRPALHLAITQLRQLKKRTDTEESEGTTP